MQLGGGEAAERQCMSLLDWHVVFDRLDAFDSARHPDRRLDIVARADETTQLNDALERLDIDLGDLQTGLLEDGGLDLGGDGTVVDLLTGGFMGARRCAAQGRH